MTSHFTSGLFPDLPARAGEVSPLAGLALGGVPRLFSSLPGAQYGGRRGEMVAGGRRW